MFQAARIAFREEGEFWNVYLTRSNTMEGAMLLGSIRMSLVINHPKTKNEFMNMIQSVVQATFKGSTGLDASFKEELRKPIVNAPANWTDTQRRKLSLSLNMISNWIDKRLHRETGASMAFSLIIWGKFGEDQMIQYVSNTNQEDVIENMEALIDGWKQGMPDIPFHERN
jgi:hypothetical protein